VTCLVPRDTGHLAPPPRAPAANGALFARALRAATAVAQGAHMTMCTCSSRIVELASTRACTDAKPTQVLLHDGACMLQGIAEISAPCVCIALTGPGSWT